MNPVMDCVALYDGWLWPGFSSWFLACLGTAFRRKPLNHRLSAILHNADSSCNEKALMYSVSRMNACGMLGNYYFKKRRFYIVIILYSVALLSHAYSVS